jgi:HEAT repeat protein
VTDPIEAVAAELFAGDQDRSEASAVVDGFRISAVIEPGRARVAVEVTAPGIPETTSLWRRGRSAEATPIGSPAFDRAIEVVGDEAWALAVLRHETRRLAQIMIDRWGATVVRGRVLYAHETAKLSPAEVIRTMRAALDLARALSMPEAAIPDALAENAIDDPDPGFRERALGCLARIAPSRTPAVARIALDDPEPRVRLVAALALSNALGGGIVTSALSELAATWGHPPEVRVRAFDRLVELGPPIDVLERALADPILAERAAEAAKTVGDPSFVELLIDLFDDAGSDLRRTIAFVLADLEHPRAERILLEVAASKGAAERLGRIGTVRSLAVLKRLGTPEASAAIRAITSRTGDVTGDLALVDDDRAGALSPAPSGRLSFDPDGT